jgi:hypothetical protein
MMQRPRSIQPRASRHISPLALSLLFISLFFLPPVHPDPVLLSFFLIFLFLCKFVSFVNNVPLFTSVKSASLHIFDIFNWAGKAQSLEAGRRDSRKAESSKGSASENQLITGAGFLT